MKIQNITGQLNHSIALKKKTYLVNKEMYLIKVRKLNIKVAMKFTDQLKYSI